MRKCAAEYKLKRGMKYPQGLLVNQSACVFTGLSTVRTRTHAHTRTSTHTFAHALTLLHKHTRSPQIITEKVSSCKWSVETELFP